MSLLNEERCLWTYSIIVEAYRDELVYYCMARMKRGYHAAEDVVQEVFLQLHNVCSFFSANSILFSCTLALKNDGTLFSFSPLNTNGCLSMTITSPAELSSVKDMNSPSHRLTGGAIPYYRGRTALPVYSSRRLRRYRKVITASIPMNTTAVAPAFTSTPVGICDFRSLLNFTV